MGGWRTLLTAIGCMAASILFCLCSPADKGERGEPMNAAYYWSTVFSLDSAQQAFIRDQHIGRIYLRYFDVVMKDGKPMPNATVQFASARPKGVETVPTIYIVDANGKIIAMNDEIRGLAAAEPYPADERDTRHGTHPRDTA